MARRFIFGALVATAGLALTLACGSSNDGDGADGSSGSASGANGSGASGSGASGSGASGSGASSSGGSASGGGGRALGGSASVDPTCTPASACSDRGALCGLRKDDSCGLIDCGPCRWTVVDDDAGQDQIGDSPRIAIGPDDTVYVAFVDNQPVLGTITDDGLTTEDIGTERADAVYDFALANDGVPYVLYRTTDGLKLAFKASGSWTIESLNDITTHPVFQRHPSVARVAIDGSGTPHVLFRHEVLSGPDAGTTTLAHLERNGADSWTTASAEIEFEGFDVATLGTGELFMVLNRVPPNTTPERSILEGGTFSSGLPTLAPVDAHRTDTEIAGLSLEVGSDGEPRVAVSTTSGLHLLTRSGGSWSAEEVASTYESPFGFALGPDDEGHWVYENTDYDLGYITSLGDPRVEFDCNDFDDIAVDSKGHPHLLICNRYFTPVGAFPPEFFTACEVAKTTLCARACECSTGRDCCIAGDSLSSCGTPASYCEGSFEENYCGGLTTDPEALYACARDIEAGVGECTDGVQTIPPSCVSTRS